MLKINEIIGKEALYLAVVKVLGSIELEIPLSEFESDRRAIVTTCRILMAEVKPSTTKEPIRLSHRIEEAILGVIWYVMKLWFGSEDRTREIASDITKEVS